MDASFSRMAKAQGGPVAEMQACAAACARWLLRNDFFTNPFDAGEGPTLQPPDVITRLLPHINDDGQERAQTVVALLMWLDWDVLPAIDGRREASRLQPREPDEKYMPDPEAFVDLAFGDVEEKLAVKVREIVASQSALKAKMQNVLIRQGERARLARLFASVELDTAYRLWLRAGKAVLRLLHSPVPPRRRIPRTAREWSLARSAFEGDFRQVGFTAAEIMELMPQGGSKEAFKARRRRARKRPAG